MVVDMSHVRWKKKLLDSRKPGFYQMIGVNDHGVVDIMLTYRDGEWQFKTDMSSPSVNFSDVDEATKYIIDLGVERYDAEFGI
jgi:hypothetical protein